MLSPKYLLNYEYRVTKSILQFQTKLGSMENIAPALSAVVSSMLLGVLLFQQHGRLRGAGQSGGGLWRVFGLLAVIGVIAYSMNHSAGSNVPGVLRGGMVRNMNHKAVIKKPKIEVKNVPILYVFFVQPRAECRFCSHKGFMRLEFEPEEEEFSRSMSTDETVEQPRRNSATRSTERGRASRRRTR